MIAPSVPRDEAVRLAALDMTALIGAPDEYILNVVTDIGARLFKTPICLLSLVDAERQWFKSCVGLDVRETAREISFCGHVVASGAMLVVEDALSDIRFADNPLVLDAPGIRFYAGYPVRTPAGDVLGTLCVIDLKPRQFGPEQQMLLRDLASLAELSLSTRRVSAAQRALLATLEDARRESLLDPLLRVWNRGGIDALLDAQVMDSNSSGSQFAVLVIDIDLFKMINDNYGHPVGDSVLKAVVRALRSNLRNGDELGRYGGDEFLAILPNTTAEGAAMLARRLNQFVASVRVETPAKLHGRPVSIGCTVSIGIAEWDAAAVESVHDLIVRADAALLSAKRHGRNESMVGPPASLPSISAAVG